MRSNWSRRTLLASAGAASLGGLAGCSDASTSRRGATDIIIHNEATTRREVTVTVTDEDDATPVDTTLELDPNTRHKINNEVIMDADYTVEVSFIDGDSEEDGGTDPYAETQTWSDAGKPLHVIVHHQIVFAVQIG